MKPYLLAIGFLLLNVLAFGQTNTVGFNIKVYDPVSSFDQNVDGSIPAGFSLLYLRNPEESRLSYGVEAGIAMYAMNDYTMQVGNDSFEVNEEDCFWTAHAVVRYDLYRTERLVTYAEGRIGVTTFFSSITSLDENYDYDEFSFHGTAFNTGFGGGASYSLGNNIWLNAGVNFHSGSNSSYRYMPESNQSTSIDAGKYKSLTHYVDYKLGFLFSF